jgi:hypothetical protein
MTHIQELQQDGSLAEQLNISNGVQQEQFVQIAELRKEMRARHEEAKQFERSMQAAVTQLLVLSHNAAAISSTVCVTTTATHSSVMVTTAPSTAPAPTALVSPAPSLQQEVPASETGATVGIAATPPRALIQSYFPPPPQPYLPSPRQFPHELLDTMAACPVSDFMFEYYNKELFKCEIPTGAKRDKIRRFARCARVLQHFWPPHTVLPAKPTHMGSGSVEVYTHWRGRLAELAAVVGKAAVKFCNGGRVVQQRDRPITDRFEGLFKRLVHIKTHTPERFVMPEGVRDDAFTEEWWRKLC